MSFNIEKVRSSSDVFGLCISLCEELGNWAKGLFLRITEDMFTVILTSKLYKPDTSPELIMAICERISEEAIQDFLVTKEEADADFSFNALSEVENPSPKLARVSFNLKWQELKGLQGLRQPKNPELERPALARVLKLLPYVQDASLIDAFLASIEKDLCEEGKNYLDAQTVKAIFSNPLCHPEKLVEACDHLDAQSRRNHDKRYFDEKLNYFIYRFVGVDQASFILALAASIRHPLLSQEVIDELWDRKMHLLYSYEEIAEAFLDAMNQGKLEATSVAKTLWGLVDDRAQNGKTTLIYHSDRLNAFLLAHPDEAKTPELLEEFQKQVQPVSDRVAQVLP